MQHAVMATPALDAKTMTAKMIPAGRMVGAAEKQKKKKKRQKNRFKQRHRNIQVSFVIKKKKLLYIKYDT